MTRPATSGASAVLGDTEALASRVRNGTILQESHWLEWKGDVQLGERRWQARIARFILGAANRERAVAATMHDGRAFMLLGVEPGRAVGTHMVDSAAVEAGLARFLGLVGPNYTLDYVTVGNVIVAGITVQQAPAGTRPYLARGTYSGDKLEIQEGRIYTRRGAATTEASSAELDEMLAERLAARIAAGPMWPMQAVDAWRDGHEVHVRQRRGDKIIVHSHDNFTNFAEMAGARPALPASVPPKVSQRVGATFNALLELADSEPAGAVEAAWPPLREITVEVYEHLLGRAPPSKVIDMVAELASAGVVERGWVDVAYPLYYWPLELSDPGGLLPTVIPTVTDAKSYVVLAKATATALLLGMETESMKKCGTQRDARCGPS